MKIKLIACAANLTFLASSVWASGMTQVDDEQLSQVQGQDGIYLNLKNFSFNSAENNGIPALTLTYTMPYAGTPGSTTDPGDPFFRDPTKPVSSITYGGISISRSDPADVFADPYQIQIETLPVPAAVQQASVAHPTDASLTLPGTMQVIRLLNPANLAGDQVWQMRYDWQVATGVTSTSAGVVHDMGSHIVQDMKIYGGGLDLAPAWSYNDARDVRGTAFGLDINMEIGALILRPRGYTDTGDTRTELALTGIKIGRATAAMDGVDPDKTKAWRVADVIQQPGIITATTDSATGESALHIGIEWYRGSSSDPVRPESIGAISVDQATIRNSAGVTNFGSMGIGGIQINYLDIKFRNP